MQIYCDRVRSSGVVVFHAARGADLYSSMIRVCPNLGALALTYEYEYSYGTGTTIHIITCDIVTEYSRYANDISTTSGNWEYRTVLLGGSVAKNGTYGSAAAG